MAKPLQLWSLLSGLHLGMALLSRVLGNDRLSALVAGTIYLPLWPLSQVGLPVFQRNPWLIPPPSALGWAFVGAFWSLVYLAIAQVIHRMLSRSSGAA